MAAADEVSTHEDSQRTNRAIIYNDLHLYKYDQNISVDAGCQPYKLRLINGQLWTAEYNAIYVYDKNCQQIMCIDHEQIKHVISISDMKDGSVIAACIEDYGLHFVSVTGQYLSKFAEGTYSDVCYYNGHIYVLEYISSRIFVWQKQQSVESCSGNDDDTGVKWEKLKSIKLNYVNNDYWDCLDVIPDGIYLSAYSSHCIYVYSPKGKYMYKMGRFGDYSDEEKPGYLHFPDLCKVDHRGNAIVADGMNNRIQLTDNKGNWKVLQLPTKVRGPTDVLVDQDLNIWITSVSGSDRKLTKFTANGLR